MVRKVLKAGHWSLLHKDEQPIRRYCVLVGIAIFLTWQIVEKLSETVIYPSHNLIRLCCLWFRWCNFFTLAINLVDKLIARCHCNVHRVPEVTLHLLSFLGGACATAVAMLVFHHKSVKLDYQKTYLKICALHIFCVVCATGIAYAFAISPSLVQE